MSLTGVERLIITWRLRRFRDPLQDHFSRTVQIATKFRIPDRDLERITEKTAGGGKYLHTFEVDVTDEDGSLVAR